MAEFHLTQFPPPGSRHVALRGQKARFELVVVGPTTGGVFLRTTIGRAGIRREEVIASVERGQARAGADWHDQEMMAAGDGRFYLEVALEEIGVFQSRAFVKDAATGEPHWPIELGDAVIKVQPLWTAKSCSIYGAFPRLFQEREDWKMLPEHSLVEADAAGWTVIPPSGKLRTVKLALGHIIDDLGFRIVMLPPIFPTPTTYARMGRYGSPFAPQDFYSVDPGLAEFDRKTTPLQQFGELADAIHAHGARIFIDVPINHTGWASRMQTLHPEWFQRDQDGAFKSPGAWGVVWEDLVELNYEDRALWSEMAGVFLFWCREGVDGFRCDAGYMLPTRVWEYITAKVRSEFPDTIFLLEGLGGSVDKTLELLDTGGLDWAYSELFQNHNRLEVDWYLCSAMAQSLTHGLQVHFAETHDNNRLAASGRCWALMRSALSALFSENGAWAITSGVEWLATEKIDVHRCSSMNWGASENIILQIAALNQLLAENPAFHAGSHKKLITASAGQAIALKRISRDGKHAVLVLVNLGVDAAATVEWPSAEAIPNGRIFWQSEEGEGPSMTRRQENYSAVLAPGETVCLEIEPADEVLAKTITDGVPALEADCQHWRWPEEGSRVYLWLPERELVLHVPGRFRYELKSSGRILDCGYSEGVARILRRDFTGGLTLKLMRFEGDSGRHSFHEILGLNDEELPLARCALAGPVGHESAIHALLTNGRGAMSQVRAAWGSIRGQYDSMLAANLDERCPSDRRMLLARCRAWVVRCGYSTELTGDWVQSFSCRNGRTAVWEFSLPSGEGKLVELRAELELHDQKNTVSLRFFRTGGVPDEGVHLILRPDVEDRSFHDKTVLSDEALKVWSKATLVLGNGCDVPIHAGRMLRLRLFDGAFTTGLERVSVGHPEDAERGLGGSSDLFSPGFFKTVLAFDAPAELLVTIEGGELKHAKAEPAQPIVWEQTLPTLAKNALRQFMVKRDDGLTVIAGYPWFLDWGRDTLIVLRGIIAAGWLAEAREILTTFAAFEDRGTLPNMIRGKDASNRDTSDAPLWFFVAVADLLRADGSDDFLATRAGGRSLRDVLFSIAEGYIHGTPNGIRMDPGSALIYSPSHFTWMDTNHPAGTPREGYPISLQAKWHAALRLLSGLDSNPKWSALADQVQTSLATLYTRATDGEFLSDCLHAAPGTPASEAVPDDHLRPNQLFAITLGAVDPRSALAAKVVEACEALLVPGAIRTLADRPVQHALPIMRDGYLLNDPHAPFWPYYRGDEDTRRKPAYHNGTAWPWPFPSYMEAMLLVKGSAAKPDCRALLASAKGMFADGCLGHLPEIVDGGAPHQQRGCGAQAWSVSEWLRVWNLVADPAPHV